MKPQKIKWTDKKPALKEEGILLTATQIGSEWEYSLFEIKKVIVENDFYFGIFDKWNDEWGGYEDLTAERYCFLKP